MNNTINGRTPEEIKQAAVCCIKLGTMPDSVVCKRCPNLGVVGCKRHVINDLLAYIQQLERERDEARRDADKLKHAAKEATDNYFAMLRERDAAVEDINEAAMTGCLCYVCSRNEKGHCKAFDHCIFEATVMCGQYEWRGVQEVNENGKESS